MSGYPTQPAGYPTQGRTNPNPYGHVPLPHPDPYAPVAVPYGTAVPVPSTQSRGVAPGAGEYAPPPGAGGYAPPPAAGGYAPPPAAGGYAPPPAAGGYAPPPAAGGPGSIFAGIMPSAFPPGTDPVIMACFQVADRDQSGVIDDTELQRALSSYNQAFSMRTVHLLMYLFTNTNLRKIGPKEFIPLFYSLQHWRSVFERFDRDKTGNIDANELREALLSLGYSVSPPVLDLLIFKFDKTGGNRRAIEYDNFIECCLTVKGLTDKFKLMDTTFSGHATFSYESFMLTVLPFLIA